MTGGPVLWWTQACVHALATLPLLVLVGQRFRGRTPARAAWLLALGFFVSFVADELNWRTSWDAVVGSVYPAPQYALMGFAAAEHKAYLPIVAIYAGLGTLLVTGWIYSGYDLRWWYPYQSVRLASFGLFGWAAWRRA